MFTTERICVILIKDTKHPERNEIMKKLGLGCMRLPLLNPENQASFDMEQITDMVDTFLKRGFTYFDTAYIYHNYQSENLVKRVLVERHPRDSFLLATKLPIYKIKEPGDAEQLFNEQLEKTGAGYFDYYLLHSLGEKSYATAEQFDCFGFAMRKKKEGKIKKFGFSFHDSAEMLDTILTAHPEVEFVQLQINYLDWENKSIQSRLCYEVARRHGKDVIIMEPVKGGALANVPPAAEKLFKEHAPSMSVPSWAIRFAAGLPGVIMVLSGMSNREQLLDNMSYMDDFVPLSEAEQALCFRVAELIKQAALVPCTTCRYCTDGCPVSIPIPDYFNLYNDMLQGEVGVTESLQEKYQTLSAGKGRAADCISCRQCEQQCPQHIDITGMLQKVSKEFDS